MVLASKTKSDIAMVTIICVIRDWVPTLIVLARGGNRLTLE